MPHGVTKRRRSSGPQFSQERHHGAPVGKSRLVRIQAHERGKQEPCGADPIYPRATLNITKKPAISDRQHLRPALLFAGHLPREIGRKQGLEIESGRFRRPMLKFSTPN